MSDVVLERVWKRYDGNVVAVSELDLRVNAGEFVVLVGPSGCGKTTTLRMVAGLESISDGTLTIAGKRMNDVPPRDRDIAMVFQSYALYPHMTVFENMAFGLRLRKVPDAEIMTRVRAASASLGLDPYLDRKPKALSGGQRQRVAMGRAIVRNARVFLFDEPLSNLDAKLRHEVRLEIARLHKKAGATMLYVTHDQVEAMTLADRIAIMEGGRLQQYGPPMELYERPTNRFVAGFLGSPSMNFLNLTPSAAEVLGPIGLRLGVPESGIASVGIRPHGLMVDAERGRPMQIDLVEPLGAETFIHGRIGGQPVVASVPPATRPAVGDRVPLAALPSALHAFDAAGKAVPHGATSSTVVGS